MSALNSPKHANYIIVSNFTHTSLLTCPYVHPKIKARSNKLNQNLICCKIKTEGDQSFSFCQLAIFSGITLREIIFGPTSLKDIEYLKDEVISHPFIIFLFFFWWAHGIAGSHSHEHCSILLTCIRIWLTFHSEETRWVTNNVMANTVPDAYKQVILCFIQSKGRKDEYKKLTSKDSCSCHAMSHYNIRDYTTRKCCLLWHTNKGSSLDRVQIMICDICSLFCLF